MLLSLVRVRPGEPGPCSPIGRGDRLRPCALWVRILPRAPMLTVAQMVEHQIVVLMVVSSILIRQPNREVVQSGRMRALGA